MRFRLRTLLILLAILPAVIALAWWAGPVALFVAGAAVFLTLIVLGLVAIAEVLSEPWRNRRREAMPICLPATLNSAQLTLCQAVSKKSNAGPAGEKNCWRQTRCHHFGLRPTRWRQHGWQCGSTGKLSSFAPRKATNRLIAMVTAARYCKGLAGGQYGAAAAACKSCA